MSALTPAVRAHLWRAIRLPAFAIAGALLSAPLLHTYAERVPAAAAILTVLEIIFRTIAPTVPAPPPVIPGSRNPPV